MRTCPECDEPIGREAEDCPHCGASFSPGESETPGITDKETDSTKYFMAAGIILLGLWALAWFVIPWHFSGRQDEAEVIVRDALASVQTGLAAYDSANGTYPASISSLGDTAIVAAKKAHSARYSLRYVPGLAGADGRIHNLLAHFPLEDGRLCELLHRPIHYLSFHHSESRRNRRRSAYQTADLARPLQNFTFNC